MGEHNDALNLATTPPAVILMAGLQGAGKTTTSGKLAKWLKENRKKKVLTVSCDVYRPAAMDQLETLGKQLNLPVVVKRGETIRFVVTNGGATKHELVLGTLRELREHAKLMQKFPEMVHDDPNAASVAPGQSSELLWKFTKTGEFYFACLVPGHFEAGMHGKIVVSR